MNLRCGQITMLYEQGFLRRIVAGNDEVLRMIYFAVRDKSWETLTGQIFNEQIDQHENGFRISYDKSFDERGIKMLWHVSIEGNEDNSIEFNASGEALNTFEKSRAGICILHPIKECRSQKVTIRHADNSAKEYHFPDLISPLQPFVNISGMKWKLNDQCTVNVAFKGDIFETEDQRNWTDSSFKTYCTPLHLPKPATINEGQTVHQSVRIQISGEVVPAEKGKATTITIHDDTVPVPSIGTARSAERNRFYPEALRILSSTGFTHYRVDVNIADDEWQQTLRDALQESPLIQAPLEIALLITEHSIASLDEFIELVKSAGLVKQIILIEENNLCISNSFLKKIRKKLLPALQHLKIGAGTNTTFADLNRIDLDGSLTEFVNYPVNPQVHAFDDTTLIENVEAQGDTVISALHKFNCPVHVSQVTMKKYGDEAIVPLAETGLTVDALRHKSYFGASWTLGSLKYLIESGASSITYYEAVGKSGLISDSASPEPYPLLKILKAVLGNQTNSVKKSSSSDPTACTSLLIATGDTETLYIANHEKNFVTIEIKNWGASVLHQQVNAEEIICLKWKKNDVNSKPEIYLLT